MRYLLSFQPSNKLQRLIGTRNGIYEPSAGFHTTIYSCSTSEIDENKLINNLDLLTLQEFVVRIMRFSTFDQQKQVLLLSRPHPLLNLHLEAKHIFETLITNKNDYMGYAGSRYTPHITVAKENQMFALRNSDFIGLDFKVQEISLKVKKEKSYETLRTFNLGEL